MAPLHSLVVVCLLTVSPAERAYDALRINNYDVAVAAFREAIEAAPGNAALHKDLAYTYLKVGEAEAARDEFAAALRLDAGDAHVALEYGFLCYETKKQAEARRVFDRLRRTAAGDARATAEQAFQNIDRPLAEGIARWSAVVVQTPKNFSARQELARLCEQRDELERAATEYVAAWRIRTTERELLVDAGRVLAALGRAEEATAALLAASRGSSPRVSEQARELLGERTLSTEEFRRALALDEENSELRREFAGVLLAGNRKDEAVRELRILADKVPQDLEAAAQAGFLLFEMQDRAGAMTYFDRILHSDDDQLIERVRAALRLPGQLRRHKAPPPKPEAKPEGAVTSKEMGERSYKAGYLQDALKYFEAAHAADPLDFAVLLKLGWTYNAIDDDDTAAAWFALARRSPDASIAREAGRALRSLRPMASRVRVTAWMFPFFSTRWHDLFAYGQVKADVRIGELPVRPYVSLRFIGDTRGTTEAAGQAAVPQYLSESSAIAAVGLASRTWHGATAWAEAGSAIRYSGARDRGRMVPDYRGGVSYGRGKGHLLGAEAPGWFVETHDDGVFVSRFDNDVVVYSQNQAGYTLPQAGGLRWQAYWNMNVTFDARLQYWANFYETGPGLRFHFPGMPEALVFSVNALRGAYLQNEGNPRGPVFSDLRAGFWYALTH